jgi:prepilin-type N-terminal cleavage/methylation domain-containing protein
VHHDRSGSVFGTSKPGLTLIEVLVAIALIALLATMVIPNIRVTHRHKRERFFKRFSALTQFAKNNALIKNKLHRIIIDMQNKKISLAMKQTNKQSKITFEPIKSSFLGTSIDIPDHLQIRNFYIGKDDEMERFGTGVVEKIWFYITPEGLTQDVIINVLDTIEQKAGNNGEFSLILNPFSAQFVRYESFQKR